jgi:pimeloyl-ACP methyl ester carboxylesterase
MPYFKHEGHRLFYREQGQGELLLILPGNTASSACHAGELDYFGARYHAVSLDFWGTGRSDRIDAWPDDWWGQGARDAAALVEHLGYERCRVMGTSGGAVVALLMAAAFPERVSAVVADSCVAHSPPERLRAEVQARAARRPEQVAFWQHAHGDDWASVVEADCDLVLRLAARGGDWFGDQLAAIRCPVLFTASLRDEALPDVGAQLCAMARQIPHSRVFLVDAGGHPLMWRRAEDFWRVVDCFL